MKYSVTKLGDRRISLTVDLIGARVGDCTARGILHKVWRCEVDKNRTELRFADWVNTIARYNLIHVDEAYLNAYSIEHFYAFAKDYYELLTEERWYGKLFRKDEER